MRGRRVKKAVSTGSAWLGVALVLLTVLLWIPLAFVLWHVSRVPALAALGSVFFLPLLAFFAFLLTPAVLNIIKRVATRGDTARRMPWEVPPDPEFEAGLIEVAKDFYLEQLAQDCSSQNPREVSTRRFAATDPLPPMRNGKREYPPPTFSEVLQMIQQNCPGAQRCVIHVDHPDYGIFGRNIVLYVSWFSIAADGTAFEVTTCPPEKFRPEMAQGTMQGGVLDAPIQT